MKKTKLAIICALIISVLATSAALAASYDSTIDPLVTLSYLNEVFMPKIEDKVSNFSTTIAQFNERLTTVEGGGAVSNQAKENSTKITELQTKLTDLQKKYSSLLETVESGGSAIYEAIFVNQGEKIMTPTGCEIILRTGTAIVVSPFDGQGLSDTTDGFDLLNEFSVPKNHNLIVPRGGDGRGIMVTSADGAYVMVRGGYTIVKPGSNS